MASLGRRGRGLGETNIWPGFVDAMTALVLVIMFVLTIIMVVQGVMREQLTVQDERLGVLGLQVAELTDALGTAEGEARGLAAERDAAAARVAQLSEDLALRDADLAQTRTRLTDAEAEAAALIAARAAADAAAEARARGLTEQAAAAGRRASAAELAVAEARAEIDRTAEEARLAAARADALEALAADLRAQGASDATALSEAQARLTEAEATQAVDAAAAEALRQRLETADTELGAMTLALEESRRRAEDTLTLLAAAEAARSGAETEAAAQLTEAERQAALLAVAQERLSQEEALSAEGQRRVALLNEQVADLRAQLGQLQAVLETAGEAQTDAELRVADLGRQLNAALLRAAEGERAQAALEAERAATAEAEAALAVEQAASAAAQAALEAERAERAEAEARDLTRYRSEFFGRLSEILSGREGVQVVGDRFVFSSDVVFPAGEATLSAEGRAQIQQVTDQLQEIAAAIPPEVDWVLRVDGHTDDTPLSGTGRYADNWELSQARALAVVRFMVDSLGFPPERVLAAGFGEHRPAVTGDSPEARAANRRIELKLTER
ncbi:peptidoglycan -binding protein [Paracoccus sp. S-4012]|uniref:peptidoglycan -binding protein n=1 Tax=Paracoccus sp. S-4012 TaxID=2665648 RepID=UPI0012B1187F|nr:peptidoglycan -binding protein [Paracoccus sp. S-4012]MRX50138.1 peptidoglycan -binding protein [Paracoccus sp. S-4012]